MSQFLYRFVGELSSRERAYFNRYARTYSDSAEKNYLKLYRLLEKNKGKPYTQVQAMLKKAFPRSLSSENNYLYKQLMNALINFHFGTSQYRELSRLCFAIDLLIERGFRVKAERELKKAKRLAYKYEKFNIILQLIQLEEEMLFKHGILNFTKELRRLKKERSLITEKLQNLMNYRLLQEQVRELQFSHGTVLSEAFLTDYFDEPALIHDASRALSIRALEKWYYIQGLKYFLCRQYEQSLQADFQHLQLLEEHEHLFKPAQKLRSISNLLYMCAMNADPMAFFKLLPKLEQLQHIKSIDEDYILYIKMTRQLELYYQCQNKQETRQLLEKADLSFLKSTDHKLGVVEVDYFVSLIIRAYIILRDFDLAADWQHYWFQVERLNVSINERLLFSLIIHYELGYIALLQSEVKTVEATLRKKAKLTALERSIIQFIKVYIRYPKQEKEDLEKLVAELRRIKDNLEENQLFSLFDFYKWAKEKIGLLEGK
ncbi:MAG: hypothetical protein AAGG75_13610 [Bacteroidota bacterium]